MTHALQISLDERVFDERERGPGDKLLLLFEAVDRLDRTAQSVSQEPLEELLIKYEAYRWTRTV